MTKIFEKFYNGYNMVKKNDALNHKLLSLSYFSVKQLGPVYYALLHNEPTEHIILSMFCVIVF